MGWFGGNPHFGRYDWIGWREHLHRKPHQIQRVPVDVPLKQSIEEMVQHQNSLVHHTLPWTVDMPPRGHAEAISKPPRTFKPEPLRPMATTRTDQFLWLATKPIEQIQYHLVMTNSLPWKIHPFLSSVKHLFRLGPWLNHGKVLVITRLGS